MEKEDINSQLAKLEGRIVYDQDIFGTYNNYEQILLDLLEDSMYIGLSILFPYQDFSEKSFPKKYYNWQIRCAVELYNSTGTANIASYSENGLSWTKFKDGLSQSLLNELISKVGTPKRSDTNV